MATAKPKARKQRIRREQVREAQRRRRERLRNQHQRFLQLLVPEDVHLKLSRIATDVEVSVQQLALDLIRKSLGMEAITDEVFERQTTPELIQETPKKHLEVTPHKELTEELEERLPPRISPSIEQEVLPPTKPAAEPEAIPDPMAESPQSELQLSLF